MLHTPQRHSTGLLTGGTHTGTSSRAFFSRLKCVSDDPSCSNSVSVLGVGPTPTTHVNNTSHALAHALAVAHAAPGGSAALGHMAVVNVYEVGAFVCKLYYAAP